MKIWKQNSKGVLGARIGANLMVYFLPWRWSEKVNPTEVCQQAFLWWIIVSVDNTTSVVFHLVSAYAKNSNQDTEFKQKPSLYWYTALYIIMYKGVR